MEEDFIDFIGTFCKEINLSTSSLQSTIAISPLACPLKNGVLIELHSYYQDTAKVLSVVQLCFSLPTIMFQINYFANKLFPSRPLSLSLLK